MFPADCLPSNYCEARAAADAQAKVQPTTQKVATNTQPKLAQPIPQRPGMQSRTMSSTFLGLLPIARQASSTTTSPSSTPLPSPALNAFNKNPWFQPRPIPKATDMDISCLPPAWS